MSNSIQRSTRSASCVASAASPVITEVPLTSARPSLHCSDRREAGALQRVGGGQAFTGIARAQSRPATAPCAPTARGRPLAPTEPSLGISGSSPRFNAASNSSMSSLANARIAAGQCVGARQHDGAGFRPRRTAHPAPRTGDAAD